MADGAGYPMAIRFPLVNSAHAELRGQRRGDRTVLRQLPARPGAHRERWPVPYLLLDLRHLVGVDEEVLAQTHDVERRVDVGFPAIARSPPLALGISPLVVVAVAWRVDPQQPGGRSRPTVGVVQQFPYLRPDLGFPYRALFCGPDRHLARARRACHVASINARLTRLAPCVCRPRCCRTRSPLRRQVAAANLRPNRRGPARRLQATHRRR